MVWLKKILDTIRYQLSAKPKQEMNRDEPIRGIVSFTKHLNNADC